MAHKKSVTMVTFRERNEWLDDKDERDSFFFTFFTVRPLVSEFSVDVHMLLILKIKQFVFFKSTVF